jgi:hypothetical protein
MALAVMAGVASLTAAQVAKPNFYVWSQGGVPYTGSSTFVNTPDLKSIIRDYNVQSLTGGALGWDPVEPFSSNSLSSRLWR